MKVGVLGSGIVGQVLGAGFIQHGHQVMTGTRDPNGEEIRNWVAKTPGAAGGMFADAARFGDLLVLVVLGRVVENVIKLAGPENFAGKTLIDATTPWPTLRRSTAFCGTPPGPTSPSVKRSRGCCHRLMW